MPGFKVAWENAKVSQVTARTVGAVVALVAGVLGSELFKVAIPDCFAMRHVSTRHFARFFPLGNNVSIVTRICKNSNELVIKGLLCMGEKVGPA